MRLLVRMLAARRLAIVYNWPSEIHYQCLYSGYRFGRWMVACSGCGGAVWGTGTGARTMLVGSSLVELLGDGKYSLGTAPLVLACTTASSLAHRASCC